MNPSYQVNGVLTADERLKWLAVLTLTDASGAVVGTRAVLVHLDVDNTNVRLMRVAGIGFGTAGNISVSVASTMNVCAAPCDRWVEKGSDMFYVGGDGVTPSPTFSLVDHQPSVSMKVKAGGAGQRIAGYMLIYVGATGLASGAMLGILSLAIGSSVGSPTFTDTLGTIGLVSAIVGAVLLAIGIPTFITAATDLSFEKLGKPGDPSKLPAAKTDSI